MLPALDTRTQNLLRDLAPHVLGVIVRRYRDFAACEDAVQEAFIAAAAQWPREGMPENPRAWLTHVASRRITDQVRADAARRHREHLVVSLIPADEQIAFAADTDGVFPESKEFLVGYWIIDVDSPERAYQIAAEASAAPGKAGKPLNMAIEVRQVMSAPAPDMV